MNVSADLRGDMELAGDAASLSIESGPLSDSDSEGGHPGQQGTSYSSLSVTQECTPSSGGGVGGEAGGLVDSALNGYCSPPLAEEAEERNLSLAVAGIIEALSVLTCVNSAQTRYEAALTDKARRSLLQHGRGQIPPADWAKYEILGGSYYVGSDAISAVIAEVRVVSSIYRINHYEQVSHHTNYSLSRDMIDIRRKDSHDSTDPNDNPPTYILSSLFYAHALRAGTRSSCAARVPTPQRVRDDRNHGSAEAERYQPGRAADLPQRHAALPHEGPGHPHQAARRGVCKSFGRLLYVQDSQYVPSIEDS